MFPSQGTQMTCHEGIGQMLSSVIALQFTSQKASRDCFLHCYQPEVTVMSYFTVKLTVTVPFLLFLPSFFLSNQYGFSQGSI